MCVTLVIYQESLRTKFLWRSHTSARSDSKGPACLCRNATRPVRVIKFCHFICRCWNSIFTSMNTIWRGSTPAVAKSNLFTFLLPWLPQMFFVSCTLSFLVTKHWSWVFTFSSGVHIIFFIYFTSSLLSISYFFMNFTFTYYPYNIRHEFHFAIVFRLLFWTICTLLLVFIQHSQWVSSFHGYSLNISSWISLYPCSSFHIYLRVSTRYGLDGPGIESRCGRDFPHPSRPVLAPTHPPIKWVPGLFPVVKRQERGVDHITHLAPRLKK